MEHKQHRNPTPAPSGAAVPATTPEHQAVLDAHGYDPAAYEWYPVRRKPRVDGWSPEKQRLFIATVADTGSVTQAARTVGMSAKSAYELRRAPDGAGFDRAWRNAIRYAMNRLIDVCMERALQGTEEPIYGKDGRPIGFRTKHHDRMAMFLLRAHMPELFRDAHKQDRAKGEALPAPPEPVADAMKLLDPAPPAAPEALMPPAQLRRSLHRADDLDGKLPEWHRDPDMVVREREAAAIARGDPLLTPWQEAFEAKLEANKHLSQQPPTPRGKGGRRRTRL